MAVIDNTDGAGFPFRNEKGIASTPPTDTSDLKAHLIKKVENPDTIRRAAEQGANDQDEMLRRSTGTSDEIPDTPEGRRKLAGLPTDTSDWRTRFKSLLVGWLQDGAEDWETAELEAFIEKELERAVVEHDAKWHPNVKLQNMKAYELGRTAERARLRDAIEGMKRDPKKNHYMQFAKLVDGGEALARDAERYNTALRDILNLLSDSQ